MARPRHEAGLVGWLRRWWVPLAAEAAATALLVGLGCAALVPQGGPVPLTRPALAFGFLVVGIATAFGEASGAHMNPAVTLAALLYGRLAALPALAYVLAQCVGATIGFGALLAVTPSELTAQPLGVTVPGAGVSPAAALVLEAVLTGTLALAVCGTWAAHDPQRPDHTVPLKLGLLVAGLIYAGGPATGASLNPARSLGPALMQGAWAHQWVYWVGPLLGAALAAILHRWVVSRSRPGPEPEASPHEEVPLSDKP